MWITPQIKCTEHIRLRHPNRWRRVSVCTSPKFACLQYIMTRTMLCCRWESATLVLFRLCLQVHWLADRDEKHNKTQQECIPVGCVPPAHWPYLVVSYAHPPHIHASPGNHTGPPTTMHAPRQPRMPPSNHASPPATTPPRTEWQTGVKILPCPKLRLRAVTRSQRQTGWTSYGLENLFRTSDVKKVAIRKWQFKVHVTTKAFNNQNWRSVIFRSETLCFVLNHYVFVHFINNLCYDNKFHLFIVLRRTYCSIE